jgi:type II secretory pathway pseudopilin PulG
MKTFQLTRNLVALLLVSVLSVTTLMAQNTKADRKAEQAAEQVAALKNMIDAQSYVFKARTANPMRGRTMQLTTDYTVKVGKDTVVSDLPYFGRAFTAPVDPTKGGIQFTSTKFDYSTKEIKKGWEVTIKPTDTGGDIQQLFLTIFNNGSASLQVTSTNRTPISFNGTVVEKKK